MESENEGKALKVSGGEFHSAVLANQYTSNVVHIYSSQASTGNACEEEGTFQLSPGIIVFENAPISPESRVYRAKLMSKVTGGVEIAIKFLQCSEKRMNDAKIHFLVPHHANLVEPILTDVFSYRGQQTIYIVMERCDDQNMYDYVKSQSECAVPFSDEIYLSFALQTTKGLAFLHAHNIINKNLRPQNLLLTDNKTRVKICDFGLSAEDTAMLRPATDGWRAPEVLSHAEHVTFACDVYSLGLIFNFLWSYGRHPYGGDPECWIHYIKCGKNLDLDLLLITNSNIAKILLQRMLERNPEMRPTVEEILRHQVFQCSEVNKDQKLLSLVSDTTSKINEVDVHDKFIGLENLQPKTDGWEISGSSVVLDQHLASGGYSDVWKGHIETPVAIKKCFGDDLSISRLSCEVEVLKKLRHKNIIKLIGVVSGPPLMVVLEHMELGSLSLYLRTCDSTITQHIRMASQIASGMVYLGKMRYVYRNLRARFIMLGADMTCKISAFGRALYLGDKREIKVPRGTDDPLSWCAPESLRKEIFSIESDVWSFGILLSEIFTKGKIPVPDWTDLEVAQFIQSGKHLPRKPNWPMKLYADVMLRCWSEDPEERPSFAWIENFLRSYFDE